MERCSLSCLSPAQRRQPSPRAARLGANVNCRPRGHRRNGGLSRPAARRGVWSPPLAHRGLASPGLNTRMCGIAPRIFRASLPSARFRVCVFTAIAGLLRRDYFRSRVGMGASRHDVMNVVRGTVAMRSRQRGHYGKLVVVSRKSLSFVLLMAREYVRVVLRFSDRPGSIPAAF